MHVLEHRVHVCMQVTSAVISQRLKEAEATEELISVARERYRVVAVRGSALYFVVANMGDVDPMYQFSLKYFKQLFSNTIIYSEKNKDLQRRLHILLNATTADVYRNVARYLMSLSTTHTISYPFALFFFLIFLLLINFSF